MDGRREKMTFKNLSVKRLFGWVVAGLFLSMVVITLSLFLITKQTAILLAGGIMLLCALFWLGYLTIAFFLHSIFFFKLDAPFEEQLQLDLHGIKAGLHHNKLALGHALEFIRCHKCPFHHL